MEKVKTFIKICGIKRVQDAVAAFEAGVDAVGFIFFKNSPRFVSFDYVKQMLRDLPPIKKFGVFPKIDRRIIEDMSLELSLDGIQIYHDIEGGFDRLLKIRAFFYPTIENNVTNYDFLLIDFKKSGFEQIPIHLAVSLQKEFASIPAIFAGNLNKNTIKPFIKEVRPFGVDISRGVEKSPGVKDKNLIFEIVEKIRGAEHEA